MEANQLHRFLLIAVTDERKSTDYRHSVRLDFGFDGHLCTESFVEPDRGLGCRNNGRDLGYSSVWCPARCLISRIALADLHKSRTFFDGGRQ